jgi:hypothetical protein
MSDEDVNDIGKCEMCTNPDCDHPIPDMSKSTRISDRQKLFNHMISEYRIAMLESEMDDLLHVCEPLIRTDTAIVDECIDAISNMSSNTQIDNGFASNPIEKYHAIEALQTVRKKYE